ncbi:WD repeat-containing protein 6 [Galendromus occidentalis]|uniref:tRNA (34-2'-O)-methyltransferase regulator WDR6 n=1 Tax=Galendromus occidentalis TaxID=34638 RepID=A0AAJ6VY24_9ACAR|nr:WD repeat-containing protein 6 [Galendromus occidentalis]
MESSPSEVEPVSSVATLAPVNFIHHINNYFLVCEGSSLSVYKDRTLDCVVSRQILHSQNVHGIRSCAKSSEEGDLICYGSRFLQRIELVSEGNSIADVQTKGPSICVGDWIWDLKVFNDCEVVLVSHNRLIFLENGTVKGSTDCAIPCLLYSGTIVADESDEILVAAGTVFNEVLLWSGRTGEVWHRLKGHDGVIFSIVISIEENLLISTSDDRSARIYKFENSDFSRPKTIAQATVTEIAACYGHSSRVWKAVFWGRANFVTVGEDGNLCIWRVSDGSLLARKQMPFKSSIASIYIHEDLAYIGGAHGCFAAINIDELNVENRSKRAIVTLPYLGACGVIKNVTIDRGLLISSDSEGNYALHCMDSRSNDKWNSKFVLPECRGYNVLGHSEGHVFTGCKLGIVVSFALSDTEFVVWDTQQIHSGMIFSVVPFVCHKTDQLYVLTSGLSGSMCCTRFCERDKSLIKIKSLALPIAQQRWATCAILFTMTQIVVGDRQGNVLLYSISSVANTTQPLSILTHLHGSNGTTDLQLVQDRILSCGRNGCMYQLDVQKNRLVILRKLWLHSPMSWVAKYLFFEERLMVAGFIADEFVVCDPETDYVLWSITAKGCAHKPWDCGIHRDRLYFATANRIDGGVSYEQIDIRKKLAKIAKLPLHRKKINCVQTLWSEPDRTVIVTGGEDNLAIISEVKGNRIRPVIRLYEHISSIKAVDIVEICSDDRLLVTCGGRAQLNVWWIASDLSVKVMDQHFIWNPDRSSNKPWKNSYRRKLEALTRYMAVGLKRIEKSIPPRFHITTACSDGVIRLFDYVLDGKLEILKVITPNEFCHQQSFWLSRMETFSGCPDPPENGLIVNAATNGELTCYDASSSPECLAQATRVHQSGVNAVALRGRHIATGGDDNALVITELRTVPTLPTPVGTADEPESGLRFKFEIKATMEKAHSAQITSVQWWTDKILMTVAIDQRVSWWTFDENSTLSSCARSVMVCIADVSGATILGNNDILIVGQGVEIIRPGKAEERIDWIYFGLAMRLILAAVR